ncbi:hypothetical protein GF325_13340 [Candidatus Bathyarchaeota archaeon]|nr:hypothetical protein [Candidatus Bathyarchaeota archaeon]
MTDEWKNILVNLYLWILVLGVIGVVFSLTLEFAGYYGGYYGYYYEVSLASVFRNPDHLGYLPIFIINGFSFTMFSLISLAGLGVFKIDVSPKLLKWCFYNSIIIIVVTTTGGIVFEIILASWGMIDWWLSYGFFAGEIGGFLLMIMIYLVMKRENITLKVSKD